MICFRDMAFCRSDCTNRDCRRHFDENDRAAARIWWGGDDAPVAFTDFRTGCDAYQAPEIAA